LIASSIDTCRRYRLLHYRKTRDRPSSLSGNGRYTQSGTPDSAAPKPGVATHGITEDFQQFSKYLDEQVEQQKQLEFQNSVDVKSNLQGLDLLDFA